MIELPDIFRNGNDEYPTLKDGADISPSQWVEFISQAALLAESDLPKTYREFTKFDLDSCSDTVRGVYLAGQGRCIIRQGDFLSGAKLLGQAYELVPESSGDARAFILLEMVSFLGMIGSFEVSRLLLQQVPHLTRSEYLIRLSEYYTLVQHIRTGNLDVMDQLTTSLNYYKKVNLHSVAAYHHKIIGNLFRRMGKYENAHQEYEKAIDLAQRHRFNHIAIAVRHDLGMLKFYQGDNKAGIDTMMKCIDSAENCYTRAFIFANLGFIHLNKKDGDTALQWFEKAMDEVTSHGIFHMLPGTCYYLGHIHEWRGQLRLAKFYLEKASKAAHELLKQNFPYNGDRERAVMGYIRFLEKHPGVSGDPLEDLDISFAIDKSLKEIRGIFQFGVLSHMVEKYGSARKSAQMMDMSERTFHAVQKRVRDYADEPVPDEIIQLFMDRQEFTWSDLNQRFESVLLKYLLKAYGSKLAASEKLQVSYPHLVAMTRKQDH
ncbi:MAG: tetratricopeptide repeat protein [Candidatus Marinimicrobia bacterium]|nr:tetratricopeptide repeat protein [Candidatus Neomarinimicrobiota bacterium]